MANKNDNKNEKVIMVDEVFYEKLNDQMRRKRRFAIKKMYIEAAIKEFFNLVGIELGKNKSTDISVKVSFKGYADFIVTYREGADDSVGNFGIGIVAGEELKKFIKDDALLEEASGEAEVDASDDEDEEDDE